MDHISTYLYHPREGGSFEGLNTNSAIEVGTQVTCVAAWCSSNGCCLADFNVGDIGTLSHSRALGRWGLEKVRAVEWLMEDQAVQQ